MSLDLIESAIGADALRAGMAAAAERGGQTSRRTRRGEGAAGESGRRTTEPRAGGSGLTTAAGASRTAQDIPDSGSRHRRTGATRPEEEPGLQQVSLAGSRMETYRIPRKNPAASAVSEEPPAKKQKASKSKKKDDGRKKRRGEKDSDAEKQKKTKRRNKRKKSSSSETSSSSSEGSSSDSESEDSASSDSTVTISDESESEGERRKKRKKAGRRKRMCREDWETGVGLWALEDRPANMRSYKGSAGRMKLEKLLAIGKNTNVRDFFVLLVTIEGVRGGTVSECRR
jgi:hypothetical protein